MLKSMKPFCGNWEVDFNAMMSMNSCLHSISVVLPSTTKIGILYCSSGMVQFKGYTIPTAMNLCVIEILIL